MNRTPTQWPAVLFLLLAAAVIAPPARAADANAPADAPPAKGGARDKPKPHAPDPNASPKANAVEAVLEKFDTARDQIVAHHQALIDQLAAAKTDTERKAVVDEMRNDQAALQDQARQTARDIRNELQALRRQRPGA